VDTEESWVDIR